MKKRLHALAGAVALLCIAGFWLCTVIAEFFLDAAAIVAVKTGILRAMWLLIPAVIITGVSGFALRGGRVGGQLVARKQRRMPFIAGIGLFVLLPAAVLLQRKAMAGEFDATFAVIQSVELVAGAINLWLLGSNFAAGLRLSGRLAKREVAA